MKNINDDLAITTKKIFYIISKAREFESKTAASGLKGGSNPADDRERCVLEDTPGDAVEEELVAALDNLNEDEKNDLLALTWIGRGDFDVSEWQNAKMQVQNMRHSHVADYLYHTPMLSDFLEEALSKAGLDISEMEAEHL
jgi:hypothetical protein